MIVCKAGAKPTAFSSLTKPPFIKGVDLPFHVLFLLQSLQVGYHWRIINFFAGNRGWDRRQYRGYSADNSGVASSHSKVGFHFFLSFTKLLNSGDYGRKV